MPAPYIYALYGRIYQIGTRILQKTENGKIKHKHIVFRKREFLKFSRNENRERKNSMNVLNSIFSDLLDQKMSTKDKVRENVKGIMRCEGDKMRLSGIWLLESQKQKRD